MIYFIIGYIICGVVAYGGFFGYVQREYPTIAKKSYREDMGMAFFVFILGYIGLVVSMVFTGFYKHGFKFI